MYKNTMQIYLQFSHCGFGFGRNDSFTKDIDTSLTYFFKITIKADYPEEKYMNMLRINALIADFKTKDKSFYINTKQNNKL